MSPEEVINSMAPIAVAMLPPDSAALEKALLSVELAALAETDAAVIATIWNPHICPFEFLPWLAWALSVDVWDKNWSEDRKRQVIAASPMVHRLKGTRKAVETALFALGVNTQFVEWWQKEPVGRRGTFDIDVLHTDATQFLDNNLRDHVEQFVKSSKPKSRLLSIRHYMLNTSTAYMGALTSSAITATLEAIMPVPVIDPAPIWAGAFVQSEINVELT